jgi:hypothetical protein
MQNLSIYCVDIGSIKAKNFGWARFHNSKVDFECGDRSSIVDLVMAVASDLNSYIPVALGFECPLFVPVTEDPIHLTSCRAGEGIRSWSASAGSGSLAVGLTESVWILERIKAKVSDPPRAFLTWNEFQNKSTGLFLWEAFVTGKAKRTTHQDDATAAVEYFASCLPNIEERNAVKCGRVRSLIGAAMLQTAWSTDLGLLESVCTVLKLGAD